MSDVYDIRDFGGCPDGRTVNTQAFGRAIDACSEAGGGRVVCGPGEWVTGSVQLRSRVELHLANGCRLIGSPRLEDYVRLTAEGFHSELGPEKSAHGLIYAIDAEEIAITGSGTIDGSGAAFYDAAGPSGKFEKPETPRPRIVMFYRCRDVRLEGVRMIDSPCWTVWLMRCEGVQVHRVAIRGDRRLRNVDGIDVDACRDVTISDCRFDTEDDCVVLRAMQHLYDEPAVCENVTVTNCVMNSGCQGVRIGCPGDGVIRRCALSNLVIRSEHNGIVSIHPHHYLPEGRPAGADISNILFSNIVVDCQQTPIRIEVEEGLALPRVADLSFSDMAIRSGGPCLVQGSSQTIVRNVRFSNVQIATTGDDAIVCRRCEGVKLTNVELSNRKETD